MFYYAKRIYGQTQNFQNDLHYKKLAFNKSSKTFTNILNILRKCFVEGVVFIVKTVFLTFFQFKKIQNLDLLHN